MIKFHVQYQYQAIMILLDEEDIDLRQISWKITKNRGHLYARKKLDGKTIYLHILVLERKLGRGLTSNERADHKNRCSTDNTRRNLRAATRSQNAANTLGRRTNKLGFHGVQMNKKGFAACIKCQGNSEWLGTFSTPEEAHEMFKRRHAEIHGEFSPYYIEEEE